MLRIIAEAVGSERAVLLMLDDEGEALVARAAVGLAPDVELAGIRVPLGVGVAGSIAVSAEPRVIPDLSKVDVHSAYLRESSRSMAGVPLTLDGEVIGVLHVSSGELDRFGDEDLRLLVPAAERAALAIGRARIVERERRIAETLQRALLPEVLPSIEGLRLAARFLPGAGVEVGGDWYDALPLPSGELAVVIGDVAGKGLRAATLMGELRAGLRAYAIEGGGPMDTLIRLNRLALRSFHMATAVLMHVAPDLGRVTFASAGHLPPLLLAVDGPARFLEGGASTPLLALREDIEDGTAALAPGDRIVLYTDGLVERRREPIDESLERLRSAAQGVRRDRRGALRPPDRGHAPARRSGEGRHRRHRARAVRGSRSRLSSASASCSWRPARRSSAGSGVISSSCPVGEVGHRAGGEQLVDRGVALAQPAEDAPAVAGLGDAAGEVEPEQRQARDHRDQGADDRAEPAHAGPAALGGVDRALAGLADRGRRVADRAADERQALQLVDRVAGALGGAAGVAGAVGDVREALDLAADRDPRERPGHDPGDDEDVEGPDQASQRIGSESSP